MTNLPSNNRKIWEAAAILIKQHGLLAAGVATTNAEKCRAGVVVDGDLSAIVWEWVAEAASELLRTKPNSGEKLH